MKLYLDTHILAALLVSDKGKIDRDTWEILTDYTNLLYTSPVCVNELIHLMQNGRVVMGKEWRKDVSVVERIEDFGIGITSITPAHLKQVENLPLVDRHNDPNDRLIIAQAISDKALLVSSDLQFPRYRKHGLNLHQNRR